MTMSPGRLLRWMADLQVRQAWLLTLFVITSGVLIAIPITGYFGGSPLKDYGKWQEVGQVVLDGGELYPDAEKTKHLPYMYPPTFAILMAPLAKAGHLTLLVVLAVVYTVAWFTVIVLSVYLATGRFKVGQWRLYVLPSAICLVYLHDNYLLGQPNLVLIACLVGAFACLRQSGKGFHLGAGVLIALAAAMKAFPVLAVPYLLWRRYWVALAATLITLGVLLVLVPMPLRGMRQSVTDVKNWGGAMLLKYDENGIAQRRVRGNSWKNQSMVSVAHRLLRPIDANPDVVRHTLVNVTDLPFRVVNVILLIVGGGICLVYLLAMPRASQRTSLTDAIETAMLTLMILMFTPLSFIYFYVWLIYPLTVALFICIGHPDVNRGRGRLRDWGAVSSGWVVLILLLLALLAAGVFSHGARAAGNTFWATLLLFGGFAWELLRRRRAGPPADDA